MGSLTIPLLDEPLETALRARAARHGRSPEEEARAILQGALGAEPVPVEESFGYAIRKLVEPHGGFELDLPPREPMRAPPDFAE
jgi:plasmid stability protein